MTKKRRSRDEWSDLLDEIEETGESPAELAARIGVKEATVHWWASQLRHRAPRKGKTRTDPEVRLLPVPVRDVSPPNRIEVRFGELRIGFPADADPVQIGAVFLELRASC